MSWFNTGDGSTISILPIDRGLPMDEHFYGMKFRSAIEKANAMFVSGVCDSVLYPSDPDHYPESTVLYSHLCSLIGRRIIYSDIKSKPTWILPNMLSRFTPKSENSWNRIFHGEPARGNYLKG